MSLENLFQILFQKIHDKEEEKTTIREKLTEALQKNENLVKEGTQVREKLEKKLKENKEKIEELKIANEKVSNFDAKLTQATTELKRKLDKLEKGKVLDQEKIERLEEKKNELDEQKKKNISLRRELFSERENLKSVKEKLNEALKRLDKYVASAQNFKKQAEEFQENQLRSRTPTEEKHSGLYGFFEDEQPRKTPTGGEGIPKTTTKVVPSEDPDRRRRKTQNPQLIRKTPNLAVDLENVPPGAPTSNTRDRGWANLKTQTVKPIPTLRIQTSNLEHTRKRKRGFKSLYTDEGKSRISDSDSDDENKNKRSKKTTNFLWPQKLENKLENPPVNAKFYRNKSFLIKRDNDNERKSMDIDSAEDVINYLPRSLWWDEAKEIEILCFGAQSYFWESMYPYALMYAMQTSRPWKDILVDSTIERVEYAGGGERQESFRKVFKTFPFDMPTEIISIDNSLSLKLGKENIFNRGQKEVLYNIVSKLVKHCLRVESIVRKRKRSLPDPKQTLAIKKVINWGKQFCNSFLDSPLPQQDDTSRFTTADEYGEFKLNQDLVAIQGLISDLWHDGIIPFVFNPGKITLNSKNHYVGFVKMLFGDDNPKIVTHSIAMTNVNQMKMHFLTDLNASMEFERFTNYHANPKNFWPNEIEYPSFVTACAFLLGGGYEDYVNLFLQMKLTPLESFVPFVRGRKKRRRRNIFDNLQHTQMHSLF